jgi:hypothetical protein
MTTEPKKYLELTPAELKKVEQTKAKNAQFEANGIYYNPQDGIDKVLKSLTKTDYYEISTFYKPDLVARALEKLQIKDTVSYQTNEAKALELDLKPIKPQLTNNLDKLKAFYSEHLRGYLAESTRYFTLRTKAGKSYQKEVDELTKYFTEVDQPITDKKGNSLHLKGYVLSNKTAINNSIKKLDLPTWKSYEITPEINGTTDMNAFTTSLKQIVTLSNDCGIKPEGGAVMRVGEVVISQVHLELHRIVNEILAGVKEIAKGKPVGTTTEQTNLFSNMTIGMDAAEITGRHQFFSPMFRGFMGLGESGLYNAINQANKRGNSVTIPYETKGSSSVYKTKLQTSVDISGVEKDLITDEAKAQRFTARLIKTQGILYLWAMHTNSLTIYNTKVTDMLRLAGYEGRIKPEHYIDITEGIAGLFAIAVTKTDDHYTDPKTGKKIYVGKNEMYGEVVRPIGEVRAIWHKGTDGKPAYIKQLIRLEIAKGMLNPTARRATLVSKALLRLNTLQERQYLQLGSFISDLFSQYQDKTIIGEPVALSLQTLLEYRGLADPDNLRRVEQTKTYLKQALDKLVDIGHVSKWTLKNGNYEKLTLTGKDLDTVVLIYPTESIQEALKPVINDDDKALTAILKQEVRADGIAITAEHYGAETEAIEAVINNRDTADSLPNIAYNELKTKAYDSSKASKKRWVK